ncbi:hypothetical protein niasHT_019738 [Heterodera trifolii]|uniref:Ig-like domain-containing protein n=1 Tax=Heterodera trifolii TaxID=157864 RepID=A0ABD2LEC6_9BILA
MSNGERTESRESFVCVVLSITYFGRSICCGKWRKKIGRDGQTKSRMDQNEQQEKEKPPTEMRVISEKGMPIVGGKTVVLSKPRPLPMTDLTLFGGGIGPRRYYKKEKESIPEFSSEVEDQWQSAGDNIAIKIWYKGNPEPMIQWFKGEEPLQNSRRVVITADGAYSELAIFDAQRTDGGFYNCRIENAMGVQERGCHVFIREGEPSGTAGSGALRAYRSVLYTPTQRYSRF